MNRIEQLLFGRTGHMSTRLVLGAAAFSDVSQEETDATMDVALSYGIEREELISSCADITASGGYGRVTVEVI